MQRPGGAASAEKDEGSVSDFTPEQIRVLRALADGVLAAQGGGASSGAVAPDAELDSQYGDPSVTKNPPRYVGPSCIGQRFSQCPPEYLDAMASFCDWKAGKDDAAGTKDKKGRPKGDWARKDAARARGWARRIRAGWKPPVQAQVGEFPGDSFESSAVFDTSADFDPPDDGFHDQYDEGF